MKEVEDYEYHGDLPPKLVRHLLAAQAVLQLEEPEHLSVPMREHLAVEEHRVTQPRSALNQLGKRARRLLEVA